MAEILHALFRHALRGKVELAWTTQGAHGAALDAARLYDLTKLDEMAAHAARVNVTPNRNVYFSAGLRRESADENRRASKDDVFAIAALKVDCDAPGCLTAAINAACDANMPPSLALFTGKDPHLRGSIWWILEEPDEDVARAERIEQAMIRAWGADKSAWNADRVMRLAGSVAWPMKKGRTLEMTGVYAPAVTRRQPYTLDEIEHGLSRLSRPADTSAPLLDLSDARRSVDVAAMLEAAAAPEKFHEHALPAVASLIAKGVPATAVFDMISGAVRMTGVNVNQRVSELRAMVRGAEAKYAPALPVSRETPEQQLSDCPFVTIDDMLARPPPTWLVDGYLTEGGLSVLWGASGAFKSFVALDLALSVAHGIDWHGREVTKAPVLYICAEGQYGFGIRAHVWRTHRAPDVPDARFHVLPVPVNFLDPGVIDRLLALAAQHAVAPGLIVVDTLARNFGPGDENSTQDMNRFITGASKLGAETRAHVMLIHHTGKDDTRGERGAYSLRGAVDTSLKLVRDGKSERIALEHWKQKDGPELETMPLRVVTVETSHPLTGEIVNSLVPVLDERPRLPGSAAPALTKPQQRALSLVEGGSGTLATLAARGEVDKSNLRRSLTALQELGLVGLTGHGVYFAKTTEKPQDNQEDR